MKFSKRKFIKNKSIFNKLPRDTKECQLRIVTQCSQFFFFKHSACVRKVTSRSIHLAQTHHKTIRAKTTIVIADAKDKNEQPRILLKLPFGYDIPILLRVCARSAFDFDVVCVCGVGAIGCRLFNVNSRYFNKSFSFTIPCYRIHCTGDQYPESVNGSDFKLNIRSCRVAVENRSKYKHHVSKAYIKMCSEFRIALIQRI